MKIVTAAQMHLCDKKTITECGIPGIVLMENAGQGTVRAMEKFYGEARGREISVIVGPGNNGGDGLVIARLLHQLGAVCHVFLLVPPDRFAGDAAVNLARVKDLPIAVHLVFENNDMPAMKPVLEKSWLIVDAIFGTGLKRQVSGHFAEVIQCINSVSCPAVAVDIPSGLCSNTGRPLGVAVRAALTTTYGLAKVGQVVQPGVQYVGKLEVVDIGIPPGVLDDVGIHQDLLDGPMVRKFLPERRPDSHKGTYGHLLIVAGSPGKSGAAVLCGQGALRSGVGLVTLCVPKSLAVVFETSLIEAMGLPLPYSDDFFSEMDFEIILREAEKRSAIVIGPGLGMEEETAALMVSLYRKLSIPMIIDADGLNLLARNIHFLENPPGPRILTPHPGEMARLCGKSNRDVQENRLLLAKEFASRFNVTLVLKGASTVIAGADGRVAVNSTGNPGMAAGGMGDVLAGLIGGLAAQGLSPWEASCLGVHVHGQAGDRLAVLKNMPFGYLASELARELPEAFQSLTGS